MLAGRASSISDNLHERRSLPLVLVMLQRAGQVGQGHVLRRLIAEVRIRTTEVSPSTRS
jgi:hypothetical protein